MVITQDKLKDLLVTPGHISEEQFNAAAKEASEQKIKESQKKLKELRELQQKFFNEQNRSLKKKYAQQIDKIEWDLIEETLKEQENEESIKKIQEYKN